MYKTNSISQLVGCCQGFVNKTMYTWPEDVPTTNQTSVHVTPPSTHYRFITGCCVKWRNVRDVADTKQEATWLLQTKGNNTSYFKKPQQNGAKINNGIMMMKAKQSYFLLW